ncbi:MAG: flagellin modification protein FlmG [Phenylobacterium sp.]|nr:flagellin modification protein FlmG [Phenylobacterium sp.]
MIGEGFLVASETYLMPRKAQLSATSAYALQVTPAEPPKPPADMLGQAGSTEALNRLNAAITELKALSAAPMLQRAVDALRAEDHKTGCEWALKALKQDERNGFGWYLLAIARERAGDFASAVQAYEMALKLLPDHAEIANDMGRLAFRLGMIPEAEKLFRHFLARFPDHPEGANNLGCAIRDQGRAQEAIAILRPAILKNPNVAMLWNTMGTVLAEDGDFTTSQVFFQEALRLEPTFPKARYNLGNAKLMCNDPEGALADCDAALAGSIAEDDSQMMRLARSTMLMGLGRIGEGWDDYEARLHPQFGGATQFSVPAPRWEPGMDLAGKSLLVMGEQGLGDEILFANTLPDLIERLGPHGRLTLAVETRLIPLFQRAFPQAEVGAHATYMVGGRLVRAAPFLKEPAGIDLWTPIASLLREFRRSVEAYPQRERFLSADPERVAYWRGLIEELPGPKIGLLWKSAVSRDSRHRYFSPFTQWEPILTQPGMTFVNLQYGDCSEEIAFVKETWGVDIWTPPGIDLKQDLDDVAALCCAMDLVLGFSNATLNIGAACGAPTWLISVPGAWPRLGTTRYPWYPQTRVFLLEAFGDWTPVMAQVAAALAGFVQER